MRRRRISRQAGKAIGTAAILAIAPVVLHAEEPGAPKGDPASEPVSEPADELQVEWEATLIAQGKLIADREADDGVGGFFDQYEYTPNKSNAFPIELGVRDARFDLFDAEDRPLFQLRLLSPTSNLGVSGEDIDQPFFNQRIETTTRGPGTGEGALWALDLDYARMRTEQLRRFPNTEDGTLVFEDQTDEEDRFFRDRTGFDGELARRSHAPAHGAEAKGLASELAVRGGFQARDGLGQRRAHRDPVNDWLGLPEGQDRNVSEAGGGVLLGSTSGGRWLATLDYDYEQLRWQSPRITEADLGAAPPAALRPIGFVPDTNRSTGRVGLSGAIGSALEWSAAYRISALEQVGEGTPEQEAAGLDDNNVLTQSVGAALRWRAASRVTLRADFDFDLRDNRIERDTALFNPTGGAQVDPFVDDWRRISALVEGEWGFLRRNSVSLGVRYDDVERSLDFAQPGGQRILPENSLVAERTRMIDVYAKTRLRLWRRLRVRGELGYRAAPETGYVTELDNYGHGRVDLRYTLATRRSVSLTAFALGDGGGNDDFDMVAGLGPNPPGPSLQRSFERWRIQWGLGVEASPVERLSLFASFVRGCVRQKSGVVTSSWQRYFQEIGTPTDALTFTDLGPADSRHKQASLVFGLQRDFASRFDAGASYTYTRAVGEYEGGGSPALELLSESRQIENQTHVLDLEGGWRPAEGLRVLAGYRLQHNRDDVDAPVSDASAAPPIDRSTHQHTFTLGVTIDGRLFAR